MKLRESGMPEEVYWETLFDVPLILDRLGIDALLKDVVVRVRDVHDSGGTADFRTGDDVRY